MGLLSSLRKFFGYDVLAVEKTAIRGMPAPQAFDIIFFCSSHVDEIWIRSTVFVAQSAGYSCCVAITDAASALSLQQQEYEAAGIAFLDGLSFEEAAALKSEMVITASSGIDRTLLPTSAPHLIHMPHSLASLHMIYPEDAFRGYDALFSCGPHHDAEFAEICEKAGLQARKSFPVGYGKLDILHQALPEPQPDTAIPHVLVAPSWGPENLLEAIGPELVSTLLERGWHVTVRPHPLLIIENAPVMDVLKDLQTRHEDFLTLETDMVSNHAMLSANLLIGDYSGTAFEFSALRNKPVVFVDLGKKVVNPAWQDFQTQPIEIALREDLGAICDPNLEDIVQTVEHCLTGERNFAPGISKFLHHPPGDCSKAALKAINAILKETTS